MPLGNALQILIGENYHCFLLTIRCNTVAVYCYGDVDLEYLILMLEILMAFRILKVVVYFSILITL